jgi:hypothetical protein
LEQGASVKHWPLGACLLLDGGEGARREPATLAVALRMLIEEQQFPTIYVLGLLDSLESDLGSVRMSDFTVLRRIAF